MNQKWPFGFFVYSNADINEDKAEPAEEAVVEEAAVEEAAEEPVVEEAADLEVEADAEDDDAFVEEPVDSFVEELVEDNADEAIVEVVVDAEIDPVSEEDDADEDEDEVEAEAAEDEDEDANLPDLEEELEIALEEAHREEVEKQHRILKGVTAGVAILGAIGLATGLSIHAYFKKK